MSLSQAMATAMSGLRVTQAGIAITSGNVANAETPGYVRKTQGQVSTAAGGVAAGVRTEAINRQLDIYVQRQLRVESSGANYAGLRSQFYDRLQSIYGTPGSASTIETIYNGFTSALQALSTSPDSASARSAVLSSAQVLTQQLNTMSYNVQGLRSDAELGISDSVARANEAMRRIADINKQLGTATHNDATTANLLDQRDNYINQLAEMMDINVIPTDHNQVTVFTNSGIQLVGLQAGTLAFDAKGSITPASQWDPDPAKRAVGTLVLKGPNGADVDLLANRSIRSGQIAAYVEMRDQVLVQAQTQLDEMASGLARALSDRTVDGSAVSGVPAGFDVDLTGLLDGNTVRIAYTDNASGAKRSVTLVRVDDPAALPLSGSVTANPNDKVLGLDFSGGMASIVSQLNAALGTTALQFSTTGGNVLSVRDDGAFNKINVNAVSADITQTSLTGGTAELPFFLDAASPYTAAIKASGSQTLGLASRIAVNAGLIADPSRLVVFNTSPLTPAGDATRPNFIYDRLNNASLEFSPESGVGTATAPFSGPLPSFMRQVISQQGEAAEAAANLKQGQEVVFNNLQERFNTTSGVNVDEEMAALLQLQNAYAANARVLSTIKEMLDTLLRI